MTRQTTTAMPRSTGTIPDGSRPRTHLGTLARVLLLTAAGMSFAVHDVVGEDHAFRVAFPPSFFGEVGQADGSEGP